MAGSPGQGYQGGMKISSPARLTLVDCLVFAAQAWLSSHLGQSVFAPVRSIHRTLATAPCFCLAVAMGDAL